MFPNDLEATFNLTLILPDGKLLGKGELIWNVSSRGKIIKGQLKNLIPTGLLEFVKESDGGWNSKLINKIRLFNEEKW
jgi:hypothetical protein